GGPAVLDDDRELAAGLGVDDRFVAFELLLGEQTGLDALGELDLLGRVQQRDLSDLLEVVLDRVRGRTGGDDLLGRGVVLGGVEHEPAGVLDLGLDLLGLLPGLGLLGLLFRGLLVLDRVLVGSDGLLGLGRGGLRGGPLRGGGLGRGGLYGGLAGAPLRRGLGLRGTLGAGCTLRAGRRLGLGRDGGLIGRGVSGLGGGHRVPSSGGA